MKGYLLDTSTLSAYYTPGHPNHQAAKRAIDELPTDSAKLVSVITLAECDYGVRFAERKSGSPLPELRDKLKSISEYAKLRITHHTSEDYAELKNMVAARSQFTKRERMPKYLEDWIDRGSGQRLQLGENDLWICAQAKEHDLILIASDRDFQRFADADSRVRLILALD